MIPIDPLPASPGCVGLPAQEYVSLAHRLSCADAHIVGSLLAKPSSSLMQKLTVLCFVYFVC